MNTLSYKLVHYQRAGTIPCSSYAAFVSRDFYFFGKLSDHSDQADCHSFTPS
jgi:hypothetical protein